MPPAVLHVNSGIRSKIFLLRFHTITLGFIYKTLCFIYKTLSFIYKTLCFIYKTLGFIYKTLGFIYKTLCFIYKTQCFIYKTLGFIYDESGQRILCLAIIFERLFILNNFYAYVFEIMFRTYDVKRIRFWFPFI